MAIFIHPSIYCIYEVGIHNQILGRVNEWSWGQGRENRRLGKLNVLLFASLGTGSICVLLEYLCSTEGRVNLQNLRFNYQSNMNCMYMICAFTIAPREGIYCSTCIWNHLFLWVQRTVYSLQQAYLYCVFFTAVHSSRLLRISILTRQTEYLHCETQPCWLGRR